MAPLLTEEESALDPYATLEISTDATEKDIKKAFRQRSLKCHPDRNPTPEAAILFRQISLSLEILIDPSKRSYVDNKLESDRRKREQYAASGAKRKAMIDALTAREDEAKKAKVDQVKRRQQQAEEEAIKDAGRKILEEAQKRAMAASVSVSASASNGAAAAGGGEGGASSSNGGSKSTTTTTNGQPSITSVDLTLILTFPSSSTSTLSSSSTELQQTLRGKYGPISHLVLTDPSTTTTANNTTDKKKKKGKGRRAVVEFDRGNWGGCWACWKDHENNKGLEEGMKVRWAGGAVPQWVEWASRQPTSNPTTTKTETNGHANGSTSTPNAAFGSAPSFDSAPDLGGANGNGTTMAELLAQHSKTKETKAKNEEYESMTLLRMRQLERQRLEEQIRREEEGDD
ncbi:hypothetical protein CI109_106138 [Kwoniella shandongensis]|uniref:Uncharacterized protein n=1 Tax=Kwoniella shandongensis TaxID=1734106 RepID=A0A5M6BY76_9TREE|nr:uncharacterized protein CI109_003745 [Kwoniella shandongensis]KAA5527774.1 hypothetical protein CI109_003745 [Kwoniella shandongensis]